jgi:hypothetical protein
MPQQNCGYLFDKMRKLSDDRPNNSIENGVRIKPLLGEILRTQAHDLRTWVALMLGDCDQRPPSTIRPNREPGRRPARVNRSGIHDSPGLSREPYGRAKFRPSRHS